MRKPSVRSLVSLLLLCSTFGCGDDDGATDDGVDGSAPLDAAGADAAGLDSAGPDAAGPDAAGPDAAGPDAGASDCFPLSGPSAEVPDAIPSALTAESPVWMRPTGETCPAEMLGEEAVYDTVCYVNDTGEDLGVLFEMLTAGEPIQPALVIYEGASFPTDPTQCLAVSSDLVIDAAEAYATVPAGGTVTLVASIQEPGSGEFQFVVTPD